MDLDGDGISDILSGCWPGQLYFFKGLSKGQFAPKQTLKDQAGKDIKIESASTVFAADWNADGKLDLLIGDVQGRVHLMLNEGKAPANAFAKAQQLSVAGEPIKVGHGDSHPIVVDWDGDKLLDLLVGCGDGSVLFYKNQGTAHEPKLAKAQILIAKSDDFAGGATARETIRPGSRVKICVVDWNGDGRLDLLTGDFCQFQKKTEIPEKDRKAVAEARAKQEKLMKSFSEISQEYSKAMEGPRKKETPAEAEARQKKFQAALDNKEFQQFSQDYQQSVTALAKLQRNANSPEQQKEVAELRAKLDVTGKKYSAMMSEVFLYQLAPFDEPEEKTTARLEKIKAYHAKQFPLQIEMMLIQEITRPYDSGQMAGSVWVYLRE
ncbi:MAG: FG-GAP-like repeat-containing protein [Gemmataceae bacterium]|nr:FG-GAP-like repeat-containing protein [Gemmataceae bacterium]MCI0739885.1 FG-GAP-like repeat-containing protein [Gemmataceae bacterium]